MKRNWMEGMNLFVVAVKKIKPILALYAVALFAYAIVFPALIQIGVFVRPAAAELTFLLFLAYSLIVFTIDVIPTLCDVNGVAVRRTLCGLHIVALALVLSTSWFFGWALGYDVWEVVALIGCGGLFRQLYELRRRRNNKKEKEND